RGVAGRELARRTPRSNSGPPYRVKCEPDEPVPASQPNQGSVRVRGRKDRKRIKQRDDFIT
ncbi:hypothetical protein ACJX0J_034907, partial [Zea mays]